MYSRPDLKRKRDGSAKIAESAQKNTSPSMSNVQPGGTTAPVRPKSSSQVVQSSMTQQGPTIQQTPESPSDRLYEAPRGYVFANVSSLQTPGGRLSMAKSELGDIYSAMHDRRREKAFKSIEKELLMISSEISDLEGSIGLTVDRVQMTLDHLERLKAQVRTLLETPPGEVENSSDDEE